MRRFKMVLSIAFVFLLLLGCGNKAKENQAELTVSAAASLADALNEIKQLFELENKNTKVNFNYGASGDLQQQISQGAPVDLFISAALDKFELLVQDQEIDEEYSKDFLKNELVLIKEKNSSLQVSDFTDLSGTEIKQIAIGTPESVPVGKYSKQAFQSLNIWDDIKDKLIYTKDVREVLQYVNTGNTETGIVYKTDAAIANNVEIVAKAPEQSHDPVVYPLGVLKDSKNKTEAIKFYEFLQTEKVSEILIKYGFDVMD